MDAGRFQEIKYDGYRIQVHVSRGRKKVYTRNGLDWTKRFSTIAGALDISGDAIIDGEVVVVREDRTNFSELQAELASGRQERLVYCSFDLLWRDGDLRNFPLGRRLRLAILPLRSARSWEFSTGGTKHMLEPSELVGFVTTPQASLDGSFGMSVRGREAV